MGGVKETYRQGRQRRVLKKDNTDVVLMDKITILLNSMENN